MTNIRTTIANAKLLQKASAVKSGWLAMEANGRWHWFSYKPKWEGTFWWSSRYLVNVKFLKLPKRSPNFAPISLIKCTARGPILLSAGKQYHKMWGMIDVIKANSLNKEATNDR